MINKEIGFVLFVALIVAAIWCIMARLQEKPQKHPPRSQDYSIVVDPPVQSVILIESVGDASGFFDQIQYGYGTRNTHRDPSLTAYNQGFGLGKIDQSSSFIIDYHPDQDTDIYIV